MDCVITHPGMPVGVVELPGEGDRFTVAVQPLAGYSALRDLVRSASIALADVALGRDPVDAFALRRAAILGGALELRDRAGTLVPADYVELTEWPGGTPPVGAFIRLRESHASIPAVLPPHRRGDSDTLPGLTGA
ncbi:MAG TPA: hypothetical protein VGJ18_19815 [Gemmatimonadaceae bacterium]|jgi:hypothetical protein